MEQVNKQEKEWLLGDNAIYNLSYDDLLKEKHYLQDRMEQIEAKKRDLCKEKLLLQSMSSKVTKRIKEMNREEKNKREQENKKVKRLELLESVGLILSELEIDTTKVDEEICSLRGLNKSYAQ